jgi:hypothetical protein
MQPSDRSKGPPKITIGPQPTPPAGSRPIQTPAPKGAPAVGTGILSGSGLNFGPAHVPSQRSAGPQERPVLVTVPSPRSPRQPAPHEPLPMKGVVEAYAKGAKTPVVWPETPAARPAAPRASAPQPAPAPPPRPVPEPAAAPQASLAPEPVEDPGPAPAWMAQAATAAKPVNRKPLYLGAAAVLVVGAIGGIALLTRHPAEPTPAEPVQALAEQPAPTPTEPLRPLQEVATAEAPPVTPEPEPKPVAKPRQAQTVKTAAVAPAPRPVTKEPAPPPVQVTPQPLAIAPPPAPVQQPPPRIIIPHLDPSAPIETRSSADR